MGTLSILVPIKKDYSDLKFKSELRKLKILGQANVLLIYFQEKDREFFSDFPVLTVEAAEDVSLFQLLEPISTDRFLFFDHQMNYPDDFFQRILNKTESNPTTEEANGIWAESLIALQQSSYGLCNKSDSTKKIDLASLNHSVIYTKSDVMQLNIKKLQLHASTAEELYLYAVKKRIPIQAYEAPRPKLNYQKRLRPLLETCQKQAAQNFKWFPSLFVLFFLGIGTAAAFNTLFLVLFLFVMSGYMLAITLEAFGLSTIKKNGAILPILLLLFPFVHLVYGLECWISKLRN